jgi:tRNA G18 (ribose-2'-O)-methylase SpoU
MELVRIESPEDPRIECYRAMKERDLSSRGGRFIAEGEHVVRRLLESGWEVESLLLSDRRLAEIGPMAPKGTVVFHGSPDVLNRVVGFRFHAGVLACGKKPANPELENIAPEQPGDIMLVCPEIAATDNMGSLVRIAAAFGVSGLLLGERCCDPFFRQSVRVSMGTIFRLPVRRAGSVRGELASLKRAGIRLIATVLDADAVPLRRYKPEGRMALLVGNEAQGLERDLVALCDDRITIPMRLGTDSLNVAVATAVILHHLCPEDRLREIHR